MGERKNRFKIKVLIPILAIFILTVLFIAIINYRIVRSVVIKKTNAGIELFTDNIFTQLEHLNIILNTARQALNEKHIAIAKTIVYILDNSGGSIKPQDLQKIADLLDIIELNVADKDGITINSNRNEFIGDDYKNSQTTMSYMALADGSKSELSEEPRPSISPELVLGDIMHFTGVARKEGGFVQLGFNADVISSLQNEININETINQSRIGDNGYGFIITDGIITAHPDNKYLGENVENEKWYNDIKTESGFTWIKFNGEIYYAGYKNLGSSTVVGLVPFNEYYFELRKVLVETVRLLIFSIIVISFVVFFVLGRLLMPIKHLVKGLNKIANSSLDARIEGSYNDEFDEIKDAVNAMACDIKAHVNLISGIEYASIIQRNLLPVASLFNEAFEDYHCVWKPKDIVSGDIYWMKNFKDGAVLCACDCTGHGTHGALLTVLVVSAFDAVVTAENCKDTSLIVWELEKQLTHELNVDSSADIKGLNINDGCDTAVFFIAKDGSVSISAGNTYVFICDGKKVNRLKGQNISIGDGTLTSKEGINVINIPFNPENKFYTFSDGLYEQIGGEKNLPFGFEIIEKIILENHAEMQSVISEKIIIEFNNYLGDNVQRDDLQLISFKPKNSKREAIQ